MENPTPLLTSLLLLIVTARLLGGLSKRWGQPALLGEMLAGVLLGPAVLGWVTASPALNGVSELSMFLIVLGAGLELDPRHVLRGFRGRALWTVVLGFSIPFASGLALGAQWEMSPRHTLFLGLCISITALPVAVRILEKFSLLDSLTARLTLSSAVVGDVLALMALGVILGLPAQPGLLKALVVTGVAALKLAVLGVVIFSAFWAVGRLDRWGLSVERSLDRITAAFGNELVFGLAVVFVLVFGSLSENLGLHSVVGAFFGSMLISHELLGRRHFASLDGNLKAVSEGFLGPVFFACLGLHFSLQAFNDPLLVALVLAVAVLSKLAAGWLGGRLAGMATREALGLGAILNGRGVMELVVAEIAYKHGFIGDRLFSIFVFMGTVTTMLSPILYARLAGAPPGPKPRTAAGPRRKTPGRTRVP
jgi:Kef-type K+ transport system membrane component KefB